VSYDTAVVLTSNAFNTAGFSTSNVSSLQPVSGLPKLTKGGLPEVLYMGAEFCPYCAAERWALAEALARFGTFRGLRPMTSDPADTPSAIPTLTFARSTYTSTYVAFVPVEIVDVHRQPLQTPSKAQMNLMTTIEKGNSSIPFVDFGNKAAVVGASYHPELLSTLTPAQVARQLGQTSASYPQVIAQTANLLTAQICVLTMQKPSGVCRSAGVVAAKASAIP
jgi:thiol-disulfide isomerase/thioredoxin